ncbi:hypothetical protein [Proteus mirabilis]|uniref:hypothetical protein n=1 Tax=Proteus mirabilis TaxID=584 RepID=UPI001A1ACBED|nr:hypothetical protein [Proteus mirabilis]HEJ9722153.1 hypothetical protein [Proteus mirabilis]
MSNFNQDIYEILTKTEGLGGLGSSATVNAILESAKKYYKSSGDKGKKEIIDKLKKLSQEMGLPLPKNYLDLIN